MFTFEEKILFLFVPGALTTLFLLEKILFLVVPGALTTLFLLIILFVDEWSKVEINGKKY